MGRCIVPGCDHDGAKRLAGDPVKRWSLHEIPGEGKESRNLWIRWLRLCRVMERGWVPTKRSFVICTEHFSVEDVSNYAYRVAELDANRAIKAGFSLKAGAVPQYVECRPLAYQKDMMSGTRGLAERQAEVNVDEDYDSEEDEQPAELFMDTVDEGEVEDSGPLEEPEIPIDTEKTCLVSIEKLKDLLVFCSRCKEDIIRRQIKVTITGMVVILSYSCSCGYLTKWRSRPEDKTNHEFDVLFSSSLLFSGAILSQVLRVFSILQCVCLSYRSIMRHQRRFLFPAIYTLYKRRETALIDARIEGPPVVLGGDGRCDSVGYSAHYLSYGFFDVVKNKILQLNLVTRSETFGNSGAMEKVGFVAGLTTLKEKGLPIKHVVTDRHPSINKYMRESQTDPHVPLYFDCWHVIKGIEKKLVKIGKNADSVELTSRIPSIKNRLYKMAAHTPLDESYGERMKEQLHGLLHHHRGVHDHPENTWYRQCGHSMPYRGIPLDSGERAYSQLVSVLNKTQKDICRMSPEGQTFMIEAWHALLLWFAPKHIHYSYHGQLARLLLCALHFNLNSDRQARIGKDGNKQYNYYFRKYMGGKSSVQPIKIANDYSYVRDLQDLVLQIMRNPDMEIPELPPAPPTITDMMGVQKDKELAILMHHSRFQFE